VCFHGNVPPHRQGRPWCHPRPLVSAAAAYPCLGTCTPTWCSHQGRNSGSTGQKQLVIYILYTMDCSTTVTHDHLLQYMVSFNSVDEEYIVRWQSDLVYTIESVLPVYDKPYQMNNGLQQMGAEMKHLRNYAFTNNNITNYFIIPKLYCCFLGNYSSYISIRS